MNDWIEKNFWAELNLETTQSRGHNIACSTNSAIWLGWFEVVWEKFDNLLEMCGKAAYS